MRLRPLDMVRLSGWLLTTCAIAVTIALAASDLEAMPVGGGFLALALAGRLSGIVAYADLGAVLLGSGAYAILEQHRGSVGLVAWLAATLGLAAVAAAGRYLDAAARTSERRMRQTQTVVDELTLHDQASGLLKRRYGELALEEEVRRARRTGTALTLILLAADPLPDNPVESPPDLEKEAELLGTALRETLRLTDRTARFTTTLFAAMLPATDAEGGVVVAEKLRRACEARGSRPMRCGVASFPDHAASSQDLLAEADAGLRLARVSDLTVVNPTMLQRLDLAP